jgi:hypothetical protein
MKLSPRPIPARFARAIPRGFRLVKRQGHDFLLVESVFCPKGHNLVVDSVRIHDEASIKLKVVVGSESGLVFAEAHWPYCDVAMTEHHRCSLKGCGSEESILLVLPGGKNMIHVCARLGCPGHELEIADMPQEVVRSVSGINYFGAGSDEVLGSM